jgi:hypothetical protein
MQAGGVPACQFTKAVVAAFKRINMYLALIVFEQVTTG